MSEMSVVAAPPVQTNVDKLLAAPIFFPDEFKTWVADFIATNIPMIPFSQVFGARLNMAKSAQTINTSETLSSGTYADLTTPGPLVDQLVDGEFLILFGRTVNGAIPYASPSINGAVPSDSDALSGIGGSGTNIGSAFRGVIKTFKSNNQNSVKLQYKVTSGGTPPVSRRWMILFRIGAG